MFCLRSVLQSSLLIASGLFLLASCGGGTNTNNATATTISPVTASSSTYHTQGRPFKAIPLNTGNVLVSETIDGNPGTDTGIQLFSPSSSGLTSSCIDPLPASLLGPDTGALDMSLFPDGTNIVLGAGYPGVLLFHLADLLSATCSATPYVVNQGSASSNGTITTDVLTLGAVVTPDNKFAFVDNEKIVSGSTVLPGNIGVVAISRDSSGNFTSATNLIGQISTGGLAIAGMLLSKDGSRLYVTSEITGTGTIPAGTGNPVLFHNNCVQAQTSKPTVTGMLTVINVAIAETTPDSSAIMSNVESGCSPTRMAESNDGKVLWVSARGDNRILAFDTGLLETNPDVALLGSVDSGGIAPVGLRLFDHGHYLAVANSNRFSSPLSDGNLAILDVSNPDSMNNVANVPAGLFPREITLGADNSTLYLTNYLSDTLQVIHTSITP